MNSKKKPVVKAKSTEPKKLNAKVDPCYPGFPLCTDITEWMQPSLGGSSHPHFLALRLNTSETLQLNLCAEAKSRPGECY